MPIYEYRCVGCGHEMEVIQKMSDDPMKDCPVCKESRLKKLISASGFQLKGSGWYESDFKNNSGNSDQSSGSGSCNGGNCCCG